MAIDTSINNKVKSDENNLIAYDERTLALQHLEYCDKNDLVVLNRGYPSYELFAKYNAKTNFVKAKSLFAPHCEQSVSVVIMAPLIYTIIL